MFRLALTAFLFTGLSLPAVLAQPVTSPPASFTTDAAPVLAPAGEQPANGLDKLVSETLPDLGLKLKQLKKSKSEKRGPKKISKTDYEGIPMLRLTTKIGSGDRTIVEEFHVLKTNQDPSPYVRDLVWYDVKNRRVSSSVISDRANAQLLHGPYKRYQNGNLVEEGFYYVGTKDGRWEKYDASYTLLDKNHWNRGFPAESRLTYYDSAHTRLKEITPIQYGKVSGTYMAFHENGRLAEEGKYDNGVKVGRWTEYYPNGQRRMRRKLTQYAKDRWDAEFEPYTISEWDERGKVTYERPKEKVIQEEETDN